MALNILRSAGDIGLKGLQLVDILNDWLSSARLDSTHHVQFQFKIAEFGGFLLLDCHFWLCGSSIATIWMEWRAHPVALNFNEKFPISAIPFPTVTICPETKAYASKFKLIPLLLTMWQQTGNISGIE